MASTGAAPTPRAAGLDVLAARARCSRLVVAMAVVPQAFTPRRPASAASCPGRSRGRASSTSFGFSLFGCDYLDRHRLRRAHVRGHRRPDRRRHRRRRRGARLARRLLPRLGRRRSSPAPPTCGRSLPLLLGGDRRAQRPAGARDRSSMSAVLRAVRLAGDGAPAARQRAAGRLRATTCSAARALGASPGPRAAAPRPARRAAPAARLRQRVRRARRSASRRR